MGEKKGARFTGGGAGKTPPRLLPLLQKLLLETRAEVRRLKRALAEAQKAAREEKARLESEIAGLRTQRADAEHQTDSDRTSAAAQIAAREAEVAHLREILGRVKEESERSERAWTQKTADLESETTRLSRSLHDREEEIHTLQRREREGQQALESDRLKHSLQFPVSLLGRILAVLTERSEGRAVVPSQELPLRVSHLVETFREIHARWEQGTLTTQATSDLFWKLERMAHTTRHALWEQTTRQPEVEEMLDQLSGVCNLVKKGILPFISRHPQGPRRESAASPLLHS